MIDRFIINDLKERLFKGKALIILGARQVGKTTLVKELLSEIDLPFIMYNGDEPDDRRLLSNINSSALKSMFGINKVVFIDEAQSIENIGTTIKLIVDQIPEIQVIATGSSSFEPSNKLTEALTGRKMEPQKVKKESTTKL